MYIIMIMEDYAGLYDARFKEAVGPFPDVESARNYLDEHPVLPEANGTYWKRAHIIPVKETGEFLASSKEEWCAVTEERKKYFGCRPDWMPSK